MKLMIDLKQALGALTDRRLSTSFSGKLSGGRMPSAARLTNALCKNIKNINDAKDIKLS